MNAILLYYIYTCLAIFALQYGLTLFLTLGVLRKNEVKIGIIEKITMSLKGLFSFPVAFLLIASFVPIYNLYAFYKLYSVLDRMFEQLDEEFNQKNKSQ